MVLAVTTLEVAVTEEDIANAMVPTDNRFLAMMRNNGADVESCIGATEAKIAARSINSALPGADAAILEGRGGREKRVHVLFLV
jgi:hypothetical protein